MKKFTLWLLGAVYIAWASTSIVFGFAFVGQLVLQLLGYSL
jgi:hypothetical protein